VRFYSSTGLTLLYASSFALACSDDDPATDAGRPPAPGCVAPAGAGTQHQGVISADETWTVAASPHIVTASVFVSGGTLTIEPCVVVRIQEGYTITINGSNGVATLHAHGESILNDDLTTTIRPITFMPDTAGTFWGSLLVQANGMLSLEHVNLHRGGAHATASGLGGTLIATGAGGPDLTRNVYAQFVLVEDSEGFGVNMTEFAAFTDNSEPLTIRGSGQNPSPSSSVTDYPILISPPAIHTIPTGTYTGNAIDAIRVINAGNILTDERLRNQGVPYQIQGSFKMSPGQSAAQGGLLTLTIESGVTIQMEDDFSFQLGTSNGSSPDSIWPVRLIAQGGPTAPIVFTSASAVAGAWGGIAWAGGPSTGNTMTNVNIEWAGGDSGTAAFGCGPSDNDAAVIISNWRPADAFIQNLTVTDSAGGGIVSGWVTDLNGPNLKPGNTFTRIGNGCEVSRWANVSSPACPGGDNIPDCL